MLNMAERLTRKLNQLQRLPEQVLVDAAWLERHGYSSSLRSQYVKSGWLTQVAPRVYRRVQEPLSWQQAVMSLQSFMGYSYDHIAEVTGLSQRQVARRMRTAIRRLGRYRRGDERPEWQLWLHKHLPRWFR